MANRRAFRIALIYFGAAGCWILFSEMFLHWVVADPGVRFHVSVFKGWAFVLVTAGLLYLAVRRLLRHWELEVRQRQQAEAGQTDTGERLRRSEEQLRLVLEGSSDGLWDWNLETGIAELSPRYWEMTGYQFSPGLANLEFLKRLVHPEDWPAVESSIQTHLAGKSPQSVVEYRMVTQDGTIKWIWSRGKVVQRSATGVPLRMVGTSSNITERKLAEARLAEARAYYQSLMETSSDGIHVLSQEGELLEANSAFYRMLGYPHDAPPPLKITDWEARFSPESLKGRLERNLARAEMFETVHRRLDGQTIHVEVYCRPIEINGRQCLYAASRDITERKRAEQKLRESEERYRQLFELESDAVILIDTETHRFVDVNQSAQQLYGYSREEFLQMTVEAVSDEPEKTRASIGAGRLFIPLRWHRKKSGERFAVEITTNLISHQGRRTELATLRDVTNRQRVMDMLRETTDQLLEAQQIAGLGSYVFDIAAGHWSGSEVLGDIFGIPEPGVPRDVKAWLEIVHPQDRAEMNHYFQEEILKNRNSFDHTYRIVRLDDHQVRWVHGLGKLVADDTGQLVRMVGVIQDITERRRAEEQMNLQFSALTAAANAIVITDRNARIEWVNPAFSKLTGYSATEAVGNSMRMLKSGQQPPAFYASLWSTILAGNVWHGEIVNRHKDGQLYSEDATITPVRGADSQIAHFIAIKQNVTEQRQMEKRIQQAQKMEAIGTLAGGIAHDFNNILAALFGYAYLLQQETEGNPLAQESIDEILKAAGRAKDLVQQILTFSRQREQKPEVIRLDIVVKEAIKFLRASLPAQIKIEMNLAADAPAVLADPTQIYQVAINLATNALHAMEGRPGQLTVRLEAFCPETEFIRAHPGFNPAPGTCLTIADTGHGMDAKTLERIFEPFFTTKPIGKGTGLGLAVVHGIVQSHSGVITVESVVGSGTAFRIYFPGRNKDAVAPVAPDFQLLQGGGQHILLLDDEPTLTSALQRLLVRLSYRVTTSNSAPEAIGWCEKNPALFDLVITDLTMPEINGLEVARQLHALRPDLPIILATGFCAELNLETLQASGICELLEKPISRAVLAEVVQRTLAAGAAQAGKGQGVNDDLEAPESQRV